MLVRYPERAPLEVTIQKILTVLDRMRDEGLDRRFETMAVRIAGQSNARQQWRELAELVTWAHIYPGIYADGRENRQREQYLTALEMLLGELLVGLGGLR